MKGYRVTYGGLLLGGRAIVLADNEDEAIELVKNDRRTLRFENVEVEWLGEPHGGSVLYNCNGDY